MCSHHLLLLLIYYENDDDDIVVVFFLWSFVVKKMMMTCIVVIVFFFYFSTTKKTMTIMSSFSYSYCDFVGVKIMTSLVHCVLMLFYKWEKMMISSATIHRHTSVVLQAHKNDNEQLCSSSSLWCGFASAKKQQ